MMASWSVFGSIIKRLYIMHTCVSTSLLPLLLFPLYAPGNVWSITDPIDHGLRPWYTCFVEEIAISKFKATCLAVLEKVRKTGKPILVTRFGQPLAEVVPPPVKQRPTRKLG